MPALLWFRRDLRLRDNPALLFAADAAPDGMVVPLFVVDPVLWGPASAVRRAYLLASLEALSASLGGALCVRVGDPAVVVAGVAGEVAAGSVHHADDFGRYGRARDRAVHAALAGVGVRPVVTGSPYAIGPGRVVKGDGSPYRVFTPFLRAWQAHGWPAPAADPAAVTFTAPPSDPWPGAAVPAGMTLPAAGETAAWDRWQAFRDGPLAEYAQLRDRPDVAATSRLSHHLRWGELHPRSLLADLPSGAGADTLRAELAWREFYADVLHRFPAAATRSLDARFDDRMRWDAGPVADARFAAWADGRTGFPLVDAGMRQLRATGFMHNRVRMVVASFLVKDLHLPWQRGAAEFARWLVDADTASNVGGWQWAAGAGTDAAPFYRVFNPVGQGVKFDPDGEYVRRWVPELAHLPGVAAHQPWDHADGYAGGYPQRIVDHAVERVEALARLAELKDGS